MKSTKRLSVNYCPNLILDNESLNFKLAHTYSI